MTNDYEPRTIVMSCVYIMLEYFRKDDCASFGFVAANDLNYSGETTMPNKRFRFYRRMMLSIFGADTFIQGYDLKNSLYLLINREMWRQGKVSIPQIENEISKLYEGDYLLLLE